MEIEQTRRHPPANSFIYMMSCLEYFWDQNGYRSDLKKMQPNNNLDRC